MTDNFCIIQFMKEIKNSTTGKSKWISAGYTERVHIEDVGVSTVSLIETVNHGFDPTIMPFGVKERTATLTGSLYNIYGSGSNVNIYTNPVYESVTNSSISTLSHGIKISSDNVPELGSAIWRIDTFSWDRRAQQLGAWKFTMTLSYVWDPTVNEIKLYADDIGENIPQNAKFVVQEATSGSSAYEIFSTKIKTTLLDLNQASFESFIDILDKDDIIRIYSQADPDTPLFYGIVSGVKTSSSGTYQYDCIEIGSLLYRKPCAKLTGGLFKPRIRIPNPYEKKDLKLSQMVGTILGFYTNQGKILNYNPGYGVDKGGVGSSTTLPGTTTRLPSQILSSMTVGKALDNLLNQQCGLYTWFDNLTGYLEYGFFRNSVTIDPSTEYIVYTKQETTNTEDYNADCVILMDSSGQTPVRYPSGTSEGQFVMYRFNSDLNDEQLSTIARRLFYDLNQNRDTFRVRFPPGVTKFRDGDVFTGLGDATSYPKMPYKGGTDPDPAEDPSNSVWMIKEMIITEEYTECIVGTSYFSIFDIYRKALTKMDGAPAPTDTKDIETNAVAIVPLTASTTTTTE